MEFDINLEKLWNYLAAPWDCNYPYNKQVDNLFAEIDYYMVDIIEDDGYYTQLFDQKNNIYIRTWTTNIPHSILCEGQVSLNPIVGRIFAKDDDLLFSWSRKFRPSRYEMGRFLRFWKHQKKLADDEKYNINNGVVIHGPLMQKNDKFYETIEISQDEWEQKYALYLLKNS